MSKIIGFDISSTTIGYAVFTDGEITGQGYVSPPPKKFGSLCLRLYETLKEINEVLTKEKPDLAIVEEYAQRFTKGRSSAHTIKMLAVFNEMITLACYTHMKKEPIRYMPATIRKTLGLKSPVEKIDVLNRVIELHPNFKTKLNRIKNIRKENYDEADAAATVIHYLEVKDG